MALYPPTPPVSSRSRTPSPPPLPKTSPPESLASGHESPTPFYFPAEAMSIKSNTTALSQSGKPSLTSNRHSVTPSEILSYFDEKIGRFQSSSTIASSHPVALERQMSENVFPDSPGVASPGVGLYFSSSSESSACDSDISYDDLDTRERIKSDPAARTSHYEVNPHDEKETDRGDISKKDRQFQANPSGELSNSNRGKKLKRKKKKKFPDVTKYKEMNRTVRQQIKPGTVEDLATYFSDFFGESNDNLADTGQYSLGGTGAPLNKTIANEQDVIDYVSASKAIQEKLILSRNNSLKYANANTDKVDGVENEDEEFKRKVSQHRDPERIEVVEFNGSEVNPSLSLAKETAGEGSETHTAVGLHAHNKYKVDESKQSAETKDSSISGMLVSSQKGEFIFGQDPTSLKNGSEGEELNRQISAKANQTGLESMAGNIRHDKTVLSGPIQAVNVNDDTNSMPGHGHIIAHSGSSGDHSSATTNRVVRSGVDIDGDNMAVHNTNNLPSGDKSTDIDSRANGGQVTVMSSSGAVVVNGESVDTDRKLRPDGHLWDSMPGSSFSIQGSDIDTISGRKDDTWVRDDVTPVVNGINGNDSVDSISEEIGLKTTLQPRHTTNNSIADAFSPGEKNISSVENGHDALFSHSYTTTTENNSSLSFKASFEETKKLKHVEHSTNVNEQVLESVPRRPLEDRSKPDLFTYSNEERRGEEDGVDGFGGRGGGVKVVTVADGTPTSELVSVSELQQRETDGKQTSCEETAVKFNNGVSSVNNVNGGGFKTENDFLSILDDIDIGGDQTSLFMKQRKSLTLNSASEVSDDEGKSKDSVISPQLDYRVNSDSSQGKSNYSVDRKVSESESNTHRVLSANSHESIEDELRELHKTLSPQASFRDPSIPHDSRLESERSSLSSYTNTHEDTSVKTTPNRKTKLSRETAFDYDFFKSGIGGGTSEDKPKLSESFVINEQLQSSSSSVEAVGCDSQLGKKLNGDLSSSLEKQKNLSRESREVDLNDSRSSIKNEILSKDTSQAIVSSRDSFRSIRSLFDDKNSSQDDVSVKRRSLNLERKSSLENSRKWRRSADLSSAWRIQELDINESSQTETGKENETKKDRFRKTSSSTSSLSSDKSSISDKILTGSKTDKTDFGQKDENMTAIVGEVSSFNIHRRMTSQEDGITGVFNGHVPVSHSSSDVFLVQDKAGDVYAVQDVTNTTLVRDTGFGAPVTSYNQSLSDDQKANEVINAFLDAEDKSLHQNTNVSEFYSSGSYQTNPHAITVHQNGPGESLSASDHFTNGTIAVDTNVKTREDFSETWSSSRQEPYTTGGGGESSFRSSLVVTNFNTPNQQVVQSFSSHPRADTSFDSQTSSIGTNYIIGQQQQKQQHQQQHQILLQPLSVNINQGHHDVVAPFQTTPVTIQTTTSAVVGEKVDMTIDFPPVQHAPNVTTTAELVASSSDDEAKRNYVIKSVPPKKSALKKSKEIVDTSQDSTDVTYSKRETLTGDIIIGGKHRGNLFDNKHTTDHSSKSYVLTNGDNLRQERGRVRSKGTASTKHHSPDRIFRNPQLSLAKGVGQAGGTSSEEETGGKLYRTVTHVVVDGGNGDIKDGNSSSDESRRHFRITSPHDQSLSDDEQFSDANHTSRRRRYRVVGKSHDVMDREYARTRSSPSLHNTHSKSFDEFVVRKSHHTSPSTYKTLPANPKRHRTVIQLDLDNKNQFRERGRSESESSDPSPTLWRTKSVDSLSSGLKVFQTRDETDSRKAWRSIRTKSAGSCSDESSSEFEGSGPYNLTPRLMRTSKQKRGNKVYVVNSTVDENELHPKGWHKSTIDINENHPQKMNHNHINNSTSHHSFTRNDIIHKAWSDTSSYNTEQTMYMMKESNQPSYTHIPVQKSPDSGRGTDAFYSDADNENSKRYERVERIYEVQTEPEMPEQFLDDSISRDMRVLRGKILIQNRMNESSHFEDDFEENVNMFDNSFHTDKLNPLYASDSDLMAALQREEEKEAAKMAKQGVRYDQTDSMTQMYTTTAEAEIKRKPKKKKQKLSSLLLSKLANVDSKDIRQTIDVKHHNEEIFGDINFIHADGKRTQSKDTSNFDSVTENVELTLQHGKAYVIIKVIAERITPTDLEFNVWRKSQAIVTRQIEIDLLANEQRRRFYHHIMDTQGRPADDGSETGSRRGRSHGQERQLNSVETLRLFSQILDVADGQGDSDHTSMRTKQEMGQLGSDLLY